MILFPNEILEQQICSTCKQYLSYGPIKISISEGVKCGRCLKGNEGAPSLFNLLLEDTIFPCVNRFDGCNALLKSEVVPEHEKICKGSLHSCPICVINHPVNKFCMLSLIHHYQLFHKKFYLTKPILSIDPNSAKEFSFLYCDTLKNILAIVNIKMIAGQPHVKIVVLGNMKDKIICELNCYTLSGKCNVIKRLLSAPMGESYFELLSTINLDNTPNKIYLELEFLLSFTTLPLISLELNQIKSKSGSLTVLTSKNLAKQPENFKYLEQLEKLMYYNM